MLRILPLVWASAALFAQPAPQPQEPQAPPDVDEALRARVSEFVNYHVTGEYRKAEALVAADSKDIFYERAKPRYLSCKGIASIRYSENFTHAYVIALCRTPVFFAATDNEDANEADAVIPGGPPLLPIPMMWKIEDGKWCWYLDRALDRLSPFGRMGAPATGQGLPPGTVLPSVSVPPGMRLPPAPGDPAAEQDATMRAAIAAVGRNIPVTEATMGQVDPEKLHHVKLAPTEITMKPGSSANVRVSNDAAEQRILMIVGGLADVEAKLESTHLDGGRSTTLNLKAGKDARSGTLNVVVLSTGEMLPLQVTVK